MARVVSPDRVLSAPVSLGFRLLSRGVQSDIASVSSNSVSISRSVRSPMPIMRSHWCSDISSSSVRRMMRPR